MLYQVIIAVGLISFMLNLILNLRSLKTPRPESKIPEEAPLISVLIPARDEEANIKKCLKSLQKQDYPNFEILVLDDNSSDGTAKVVERIAASDKRIQLFRGKPLPKGWAGKPFACQQLAKKAKGSWLLFTDADTTHEPHALRSTLAMALKYNSSLLSGFPRQLTTSLPQKITIPVLYFVIMSWFPLWWLQRAGHPRPSLAIGQFLFFPTKEYWRIGGHKAVKAKILEDVWLGIEINRHGGRHVAVDLSPIVSCHMYQGMGAIWEGVSKWLYSVAALSKFALAGLLVAGYLFFLAPFYWLWNELFVAANPSDWRLLIILQVGAIVLMRWLVDKRFHESIISTVLHPIGFSFLIITGIYAGSRQAVGAGVHWKARLYSKESSVT
jgi:chlorobactene glucosyltransferase